MSAAEESHANILLDVTVPRLKGITGALIRGALGVTDLATLFEAARVGQVNDDGHHSTFRLALEPGTDVGKQTKMGLIAVGNDKGQVRLCLPWSWRNFVSAAGFTVTQGQDENEKPVAMIWQDPKPGDGFEIPLPVGRAAGLKLAVKVV